MNLSNDWDFILDKAKRRYENNKTIRQAKTYSYELEVLGVAGEVCTRKMLGVPIEIHECFDGGVDISFAGVDLDVKTTVLTPKIFYRFLQFRVGKVIKADAIVMAAVDPISKQGIVLGWAYRRKILKSFINYSRTYPCYEIPISELNDINKLIVLSIGGINDPRIAAGPTLG